MAEKTAKKKQKAAEPSVLGTLSSTRPSRIGGDRRGAAATKPKRTAARKAPAKTSAPKQAEAKAAKLRKPDPAPPAGWQTPSEDRQGSGATGVVTTAVQAAGELAQLGVAIGGQLLKRAAGRIPRP
jgi:hypothetical protein